jgi:hypothetical protein
MKNCQKCGAEMPDDFKVCGKCGNSLDKPQKEMYDHSYDIFLSYRRDGGEMTAILLRDRLTEKGYRVFLDVENLNSGSFNTRLLDIIDKCKDVLVICSKGSLDRCVNEGDWVRLEVAHALGKGKNVIPIMLRGFVFPDVLPDDIEALRMQNGVNANSHEYFDAALERLAEKFLLSEAKVGKGKKTEKRKERKEVVTSKFAENITERIAVHKKDVMFAAAFFIVAVVVVGGIGCFGYVLHKSKGGYSYSRNSYINNENEFVGMISYLPFGENYDDYDTLDYSMYVIGKFVDHINYPIEIYSKNWDSEIIAYTYDSNDRIVESKQITPSKGTEVRTYDIDGNVIDAFTKSPDGDISVTMDGFSIVGSADWNEQLSGAYDAVIEEKEREEEREGEEEREEGVYTLTFSGKKVTYDFSFEKTDKNGGIEKKKGTFSCDYDIYGNIMVFSSEKDEEFYFVLDEDRGTFREICTNRSNFLDYHIDRLQENFTKYYGDYSSRWNKNK